MKFYSEVTKSFYDSPEECISAEEEVKAKEAAELARKEKLANEKKAREAHLDELSRAVEEAQEAYHKAFKSYLRDYGTFSRSYDGPNGDRLMSLIEGIFDF